MFIGNNPMNLALTKVSDDELVRRIDSARQSVALYAPGVGLAVANALCRATVRLRGNVKVALDVSQKSVDMGFLEPEAIRRIWYAQSEHSETGYIFYHVSGIRLGTLFVDSEPPLAFVPFAKLMEDENMPVVAACPSGIEVPAMDVGTFGQDLAQTIVKVGMVRELCDVELSPARPLSEIRKENEALREQAAESERRVAEAAVRMAEAEKKVAEAEAKMAEAERRVADAGKKAVEEYKKAFTLRKVDFSVHCDPNSLDRRKVTIPPYFLVGMKSDAAAKLQAKYQLFPDADSILAEVNAAHSDDGESAEDFSNAVESFRRLFLLRVRSFGSFERIKDCQLAELEIIKLKDLGRKVNWHIQEAMFKHVKENVTKLADALSPQLGRIDLVQLNKMHRYSWNFFEPAPARKIFIIVMTKLAKKHIAEFKVEVKFSTTLVDESLMNDQAFREALAEAVLDRNRLVDKCEQKFNSDELLPLIG